jgi:hypothetical protein
MRDDANAAAYELVEFAEASVGAHGHDDRDGRKVIALSKHLQLHNAAEISGILFVALSDGPDAALGHGMMQVRALEAMFFGDLGNLFGVAFTERRKQYARFHRIKKLALRIQCQFHAGHDLPNWRV